MAIKKERSKNDTQMVDSKNARYCHCNLADVTIVVGFQGANSFQKPTYTKCGLQNI